MRIGSLFSGIGGLELGLEWSGLGHTVWQVEQSEFCRGILAKHWPDAERFEDVKEVGAHNLGGVDLICGGFPCQDISSAGKGEGLSGSRSGLWFEFARIIQELAPRWVVVENVASGAKRWVDQVTNHLGELGYETIPIPISAADVGAPHLRRRVFLIAYSERYAVRNIPERLPGRREGAVQGKGQTKPLQDGEARYAAHSDDKGEPTVTGNGQTSWVQSLAENGRWEWGPPVPPICGVDDGVPNRMDRLRALGNAVVPQCAEVVGWVIRELEGA